MSLSLEKRSSEDLQDESKSNKHLNPRLDLIELMFLEANEVCHLRGIACLPSLASSRNLVLGFIVLNSDLGCRIPKDWLQRKGISMLRWSRGYRIIMMFKIEVKGKDPKASKKKLIGAAEALNQQIRNHEEGKGHAIENKRNVERNWETATGFPPRYMTAVTNLGKKFEARNILVHKTASQLARLLVEEQHPKIQNYHHLGGLLVFLYGRIVEEMAREVDAKNVQREQDRNEAGIARHFMLELFISNIEAEDKSQWASDLTVVARMLHLTKCVE
ncbi:hypothetical protein N7G274_001288 [Stereocaulon virgatum]|uniref:Uncharacterized protein n=1 Tax=Stereocaulon virgatum TaxID=373712 RepID=A0ABR4ARI9_9LECA